MYQDTRHPDEMIAFYLITLTLSSVILFEARMVEVGMAVFFLSPLFAFLLSRVRIGNGGQQKRKR